MDKVYVFEASWDYEGPALLGIFDDQQKATLALGELMYKQFERAEREGYFSGYDRLAVYVHPLNQMSDTYERELVVIWWRNEKDEG